MNDTDKSELVKAAEEAVAQDGKDSETIVNDQFNEMLNSPITKDEAEKSLADNDVQLAQLRVLRVRKLSELNQIEHQIEMANFERSVIFRRSLNVTGEQ